MSMTNRSTRTTRLAVAALLSTGAVALAPATLAHAEPGNGQPEKVFVCKYVGTPNVDERLQTGNNPIEVSVNAIPIYTGQPAGELIGREFADAQGRSIVIAVSPVRGGGQGDEPTIEDCPAPDGPPEEEVVKVSGTPTLADPCGPGNEVLSTPPAGVVFTPVDMGTSVQVTVSAAAGHVLDQAQTVFDLPVNDAACPSNPQTPTTPQDTEVQPETGTQTPQESPDVLGEQAFAPTGAQNQPQSQPQSQLQSQPQVQPRSQQALPTAVNAGAAPVGAPDSGTDSLLAMLLVMLGAVSARLGWIRARG